RFEQSPLKRVELNQLIASAHVGAIPDARLEVAAYALGRQSGQHFLAWFGAELPARDQSLGTLPTAASYSALAGRKEALFEPSRAAAGSGRLERVTFRRGLANGRVERTRLELISPRRLSLTTYAVLPYLKAGGEIRVGLETRELPAFEKRGLAPRWAVVPA